MSYIDQIATMGACPNALDWLREAKHPTPEVAWNACSRADWMVWLVARSQTEQPDRQALVLCICDIAETVLCYVPAREDRPRIAIETARRWARGEATEDEVRAAARAAYAAYNVVFVVATATAAAKAVAYTAVAQSNVTAAVYATDAVSAAAWADAAAKAAAPADVASTHFTPAAYAAYANIVRRYFPNPPILEGV